MPSLPKSRRRPWTKTAPSKPAHFGRKTTNPFYHTKAWRNFRAQQKTIAIEQTKQLMQKLIKEEKPVALVFARMQPLCQECLKETAFRSKKYTVARVLDHIKPINPADAYNTRFGRFGDPLSPTNVQWLCDTHHAQKSGREHLFHKNR